jgi:hypothetical protein
VLLLLLTAGWALSGLARRRELRRLRKTAQQQQQQQRGAGGPGVTVVLPVKHCRPHSRANWRSQLAADYGAPLPSSARRLMPGSLRRLPDALQSKTIAGRAVRQRIRASANQRPPPGAPC